MRHPRRAITRDIRTRQPKRRGRERVELEAETWPDTLRVRDVMTRGPVTIRATATIGAAWKTMRTRRLRHLPVLGSNGRLIGIVTDRDLRQATLARVHALRDAERDLLVQDVMTCAVVTIDAEASVSRAARLMYERRIGSLPVVEAGRLVGIVTERDLLRALMRESPARAPVIEPFLW
jgi:acetoin utilization protein AcuB